MLLHSAAKCFFCAASRSPLAANRDVLLEILFPMPADSEKLALHDIVEFKAAHQGLATGFLESVQQECTLFFDGATHEEHQDRIQALGRKLQGEADEIAYAMQHRWKKIIFGNVLPVLAPVIPLQGHDQFNAHISEVGAPGARRRAALAQQPAAVAKS